MTNKKTILLDLDDTTVDMLKVWLSKYNVITGECVRPSHILDYELRKFVKYPDILNEVLVKENFFFEMHPILNAPEIITRMVDEKKHDLIFLTQLPRGANHWALLDKRRWVSTWIPKFDTANMIFTHRKDLIHGDVLFDDAPHHIVNWKANNPNGKTFSIDYPFNRHINPDYRFKDKSKAWLQFYEIIESL